MNTLPIPHGECLDTLVADVAQALTQRHWRLATAESCTGGLIATTCTDHAGASAWFDRAAVTYSNQAKQSMLGVPAELIERDGSVSESVVRAMAEGMLLASCANMAVAVSGVAGPNGGSPDKPLGTVWVAWAIQDQATTAKQFRLEGDRAQIRWGACKAALLGVLSRLRVKQEQSKD